MKILGIYSSTERKNNSTTKMMETAIDSAKENGAEVELINIREQKITPCKGCGFLVCNKGCIIDDDVIELYDKIKNADALLLGTSVNLGLPNAKLVALLQRLVHLRGKQLLKDKPVSFIVTGLYPRGGQTLVAMDLARWAMVCDMIPVSNEPPFDYDCHNGHFAATSKSPPDENAIKSAKYAGKRLVEFTKKLKGDGTLEQ
ncbi:hypothetical protein CL614_05195 [archaeon]|nr:hypothetical protein [archaeon]|tara:strand:- start:1892 stop:2494 length:603 start_codon:yes stop_codon:yes gene_type:complete